MGGRERRREGKGREGRKDGEMEGAKKGGMEGDSKWEKEPGL